MRGVAGVIVLALLGGCAPAAVTRGGGGGVVERGSLPSVSARTAGLERRDGFIPFYHDPATGKLYLEVARVGEEFLYLNSLATGLGTNSPTLDRGQVGDEALVRFERHGGRLLLVRQNTGFRVEGVEERAAERAVEESFPTSVVGVFPVVAASGERVLVDATDFFLQDVFDVRGRLRRAGEGEYRVDRDRSAIWLPRTKAFPRNTEVEALLTFASDAPGRGVARHAPDGRWLTLRQHHSFVALPPPGYRPRALDPRVGVFSISFYDFARPLDDDYRRRWIVRHRLEKRDPGAAVSEPVEPIVYYLDRGIPEPYRAAFREGAMWWAAVLEAAGFRNAFRVEDLPEGADPMDARYNLIEWVHRTEPGSSWGTTLVDPRTGEIIKAVARMDSYRSLVDYNIFAGARPAGDRALGECGFADAGPGDWIAALDPDVDPVALAMARRRQHAAHEVGHTLGLAHNFIAASYGRASVMDYPAPLIRLDSEGRVDLSDAYRPGPGAYDTLAIRYAYSWFATPEEEAAGLEAIVADGLRLGLRFITDSDADASGSIPEATRWVNGGDMLAELDRVTVVRRALLDGFGAGVLRPGEPWHRLSERLAPVYLHHRYTLEGAIKAVGRMDYAYALKGDGQTPTRVLDPAVQRAALGRLVAALEPEALRIPERIVALIAPPPYGQSRDRRAFGSPAGPAFDPLAAARMLSAFVVDGLLHPERAARLVSFHARDARHPSLDEVVARLVEATWDAPVPRDPGDAALRRVARRAVLDGLISLARDPEATVDVRAAAEWHLARLADRIVAREAVDPIERADLELAWRDVRRFLERRDDPTEPARPLPPPPGTPIGQGGGRGN